MDFIKATGSGRDFRLVGEKINFFFYCPKNGWLEQTPEGVKPAMFSIPGFLKGEFEFVPDEVIEVGDEISLNEDISDFKRGIPCDVVEVCPDKIKVRTYTEFYLGSAQYELIRKGPKVYTFEGVELHLRQIEAHWPEVVIKNIREKVYDVLAGNKTYTMTLKEEVSE